MADDSEFLSRLISFGLSEKDFQVNVHNSMHKKSRKIYLDLPEPIGKAQSILLNSFPSAPHTGHFAGGSISTVFPQ